MSKKTIIGEALPNIPWEDRPENCTDPIWRYSLKSYNSKKSNTLFKQYI